MKEKKRSKKILWIAVGGGGVETEEKIRKVEMGMSMRFSFGFEFEFEFGRQNKMGTKEATFVFFKSK